jgi:signal peptidase I
MLCDNRDNSTDSRVTSIVGTIPLEDLAGRVEMIFFSRGAAQNGAPATVQTERIGMALR